MSTKSNEIKLNEIKNISYYLDEKYVELSKQLDFVEAEQHALNCIAPTLLSIPYYYDTLYNVFYHVEKLNLDYPFTMNVATLSKEGRFKRGNIKLRDCEFFEAFETISEAYNTLEDILKKQNVDEDFRLKIITEFNLLPF